MKVRWKRRDSYIIGFAMIIALFLLAPMNKVEADVSELGNVINSNINEGVLELTIDNGDNPNNDILVLETLKADLLRVNYRPNGETESPDTPILDPNRTFNFEDVSIDTSGDPITITTSQMKVEISKSPTRTTIRKPDGTTLLWEPSEGGVFHDGVRFKHNVDDNIYGIRSYNAFEGGGDLLRNNNEHGAHAGQQGDSGGPFFWSTAGYGLLVDSDGGYPYTEEETGKMEFYYGGTPEEGRRYEKRDVEYFIMIGDTSSIMDSFTDLTGDAPLMPKWSLGFSNFEWDTNQAEMTSMIDTYRAKDIPIDSYGLDYDWKDYGEDNYGSFRWNTDNFPDSSTTSFKDQMNSKGIKMIGITKPRIVTENESGDRTLQYQDAEDGDYWYPGHEEYQDYFIPVQVRSIDPYNSSVRDWLWNNYEDAFDKGIVGWWNDETDKVSSNGTEYWFGNFTTAHFSQALYEGQRNYTNDTNRVWQTARTYYPGTQRYATTLWSGDIGAQFYKGEKIDWASGMQEQKSVMLSSINNGQPKWGMDIGGFNQEDGQITNPSPELYTRWMQFGAFSPVFRVHGNNNHQRQPWFYGNTAEEVSKQVMKLRYSLMPYMYTYEREVLEEGTGLVKPLMQVYPNLETVENYTDGWMFGDYLYVSPVVEENKTSKDIYLPPGQWIDYFTGISYAGDQTIHYSLDSNEWTDIPLFIKKGAIIPSQKTLDYVGQEDITQVNVDIFPSESETSFTYYDDDGESYSYENGDFLKQEIKAIDQSQNGIEVTIEGKQGSYTSPLEDYFIEIHGTAATDVTVDESVLTFYNDKESLLEASGEGYAIGKDEYGVVTYVKASALGSTSKTLHLTGGETVNSDTYTLEAEQASLSGDTVSTQSSVNNNHAGFTGTGFVDSMDQVGAKVTFYPKVKTSGQYDIQVRYANGSGADQTLSLFVNGDYEKQVTFSATTSWDDWATVSVPVSLDSGQSIISFINSEGAGDSGRVNIDHIAVPFDYSTASYEAEASNLGGGAGINQNHWFYSGEFFVDGLTSEGSAATFHVYAPEAGDYELNLDYANGTQNVQTLSLFANGKYQRQLSLDHSGGNWNIWQTATDTVTLNKGINTVTYQYTSSDSGNVNLDKLDVKPISVSTVLPVKNLLDNGSFERNISLSSNWTEWHPSDQELAYGIDEGIGTNPPETAFHGDQRAYFYQASAYEQSIHQVINVPNNNTEYTVEAWVRLKNANPNTARLEITNYGGTDQFIDISKGEEWKLLKVDNIMVTNGQIDVGFYVDSPGGTTLHIDQVKLITSD
ncbi:TIM-barrel domain-containing protein [Gracilibacillus sp. YIM 98692]|uniref:TIM-barrel domain-containing protein n=1 Tax=Gracilibacillus sp. YIM 98692 TaxID=2663532 RepID=UPI0013D1561A|nr:TIM-barrel domain-containing protein [Gracilibacillus sp. YIM 98692]